MSLSHAQNLLITTSYSDCIPSLLLLHSQMSVDVFSLILFLFNISACSYRFFFFLLFLEKIFQKIPHSGVSWELYNFKPCNRVIGWLCQERGKIAGMNEAVHSAAFGINKSLLLSCSCSSSLQQERGAERNGRRGVRHFSRALLGKRGKCKVV